MNKHKHRFWIRKIYPLQREKRQYFALFNELRLNNGVLSQVSLSIYVVYPHLSINVIVSVQSLSIHQVYYNDNNINFTCFFFFLLVHLGIYACLLTGLSIWSIQLGLLLLNRILSYQTLSAVSVFHLLHWTCYCLSYHK